MPWNDGLQGQALQIAATPNSPLCVVAGPGTGKTFALMRRLTRLIEVDGADAERILACTFTRTAAEDITRAVANLGVAGADDIATATVHGLCFSMLSREDVLAATGRVPRPLLRFEERFLLQDISKAGLGGIRDCGKTLRAFSAAWARLQHEEPGWPNDQRDQAFQAALIAWLRFHRAMLIGELIPEGIKYLRLNAQSPFRTAFDHVLVDEYQDLNRAEQELIDLLSNGSLVVIGDEDQSIYSFKYAHPEGIVQFPVSHANTESAGLDECRRCPHRVVAMANALIAHNVTRSARQLRPFPGNPQGEIINVQWRGIDDEASGIARFISTRIAAGTVQPGNILVLAPRREFGYAVRDALVGPGVPAHSFFSEQLLDGDPKQIDDCKAQQALVLLILAGSQDDRVALRCWCGLGHNTLADGAWAKLRSHCEHTGDTPWQGLTKLAAGQIRLPHTQYLVDRFNALTAELGRIGNLRGDALIDAVLPGAEEWAVPLRELSNHIEEEDFDAAALCDAIRRNISQPEMPTNVDYVRVMSLHKSKGLTAELVIIAGCLDGLMPAIDDDATPDEQTRAVEEQRRLFYVAVTRTKQTLLLSSVSGLPTAMAFRMRARTNRTVHGIARTVTSRYVHELGPQCPAAITGDQFVAQYCAPE
jgi:DNA helicase-2/ATP-dependent DNA helicase PcrA